MLSIALAAQLALAALSAAPAHISQMGGGAAAAGGTTAPVQDHLPRVTFVVPGRPQAPILFSENAVMSDPRGTFVYIIDDNDTIVRRDVAARQVGASGMVVVRGLDGDERVVDRAGPFLMPGERVRPERARLMVHAMTAGEAIEIANLEIALALPQMEEGGRTIRTDEADGKWHVTYASPGDADAGGPVIVEVDKRTGQAAIVQMPQ